MNRSAPAAAAIVIGLAWAILAGQVVSASTLELDSLDQRDGRPVRLKAHWLPAPRALPRAPAAVLLHGCGGPYARDGRLSERMLDYASLLHGLGMHALVVDSLASRGQTELCTQAVGQRSVTQAHRRLDALAALAWLARREDVDADRLGLIGWSNGGSTVLAASNLRHRQVSVHRPSPKFAVAFYPGCEAELKRGYAPSARLLLLVGAADDWTPAEPCLQLATTATEPTPAIESYADAHHGFDSTAPVRLRRDVPGGVNPGQGVHVGGQAEARRRSRERLLQFLAEQ